MLLSSIKTVRESELWLKQENKHSSTNRESMFISWLDPCTKQVHTEVAVENLMLIGGRRQKSSQLILVNPYYNCAN